VAEQSLEHLVGVGPDLLVRVQGADHRGDADEDDVGADDDGQYRRGVLDEGGEAVGPERVITLGPCRS
jgi:hypothetical protein